MDQVEITQRIGTLVQAARLQANLSQVQASEASGLSVTSLSRIENGHQMPSVEVLARLAIAFQVKLIDLTATETDWSEWLDAPD